MLEDDDEMSDFTDNIELMLPLEPRDAFFGGRVSPLVLLKEVERGQRIQYADFVSCSQQALKLKQLKPVVFTGEPISDSDKEAPLPPRTPKNYH